MACLHLDNKQYTNKEEHIILSTTEETTKDCIVAITSLDGRPMNFLGVGTGLPEKKYAITGVPLEVESVHFIVLHEIRKTERVIKGNTPIRCMVLTSTYHKY